MASLSIEGKLQSLQKIDEEKTQITNSLVQNYREVQLAIEELKKRLEGEIAGRKKWKGRFKDIRAETVGLHVNRTKPSFVMVLVDADHAVFCDDLIQKSSEGGRQAARALKVSINDYLRGNDNIAQDTPVYARLYANVGALARQLQQTGIISNSTVFVQFTEGFTMGQPTFDFVNVGQGKERADFKITELLESYITNPLCLKLILGICHDNGYINVLEKYVRDNEAKAKITLLETTPSTRQFTALPLDTFRITSVFRRTVFASTSEDQKNGVTTPQKISRSFEPTQRQIYFNRCMIRIDDDLTCLPRLSHAENKTIDKLTNRSGDLQACFPFHINGKCLANNCTFKHEPRLPEWARILLIRKLRHIPCPRGACQNFDCYFGHNCPLGNKCPVPGTDKVYELKEGSETAQKIVISTASKLLGS